jgi:decaprenyl-phosphate phosphoribosyltransferase
MRALWNSLRSKQWIKNGLIFAPWFASGGGLSSGIAELLLGLVVFSLISSSVYIFNDLRDIEEDRKHPIKSNRPIAAGLVPPVHAFVSGTLLLSMSLVFSLLWLPQQATLFLIIYVGNSVIYVLFVRNVFLLDLFFLSAGFVLRVLFGGAVSMTPVSSWLLVVIGAFAFFVATGKRFSEIRSGNHLLTKRRTLHQYTSEYLLVLLIASLSSVIVFYALWTIEGASRSSLAISSLVPLTFLLFRYLQSVLAGEAEAPERVLFHDPMLLLGLFFWIIIFSVRFL